MKKLFTLIIVAGLALTMQAQDITNTLGQDGFFYIVIENSDLVNIGSYSGSGYSYTEFAFYNELNKLDTDFEIYNAGGSLDLNLMKANGNSDNPSNVVTGDILGNINFSGFLGNLQAPSATISASVSGVPGSHVPGELIFKTGTDAADPATRMTIKSDGTVYIANTLDVDGQVNIANTLAVAGTVNIAGSLTLPVNTQNADYTVTDQDYLIYADPTITITLPDANVVDIGRIYVIKRSGTGTGSVTVESPSSSFDGATSVSLNTAYAYIMVQCLGSGHWMIISQN